MPEVALPLEAIIRQATRRLGTAGIAEPRREALNLWSGLEGVSPGAAILAGASSVSGDSAARFEDGLERRVRGEPLAYVTGWAGFRRLVLRADRRALIPRPETEGLVELVLERVRTGRVADIGTGTGCIGLSLLQEGRYQQVIGVERSRPALDLARENRERSGLPLALAAGDCCEPLGDGQLDAVLANPPYVARSEYEGLDSSVRDWEPPEALVSGEDGLEVTRQLLAEAGRPLRPDGLLALEVDAGRGAQVARMAAEMGWNRVTLLNDLFGRARYLLAQRSKDA